MRAFACICTSIRYCSGACIRASICVMCMCFHQLDRCVCVFMQVQKATQWADDKKSRCLYYESSSFQDATIPGIKESIQAYSLFTQCISPLTSITVLWLQRLLRFCAELGEHLKVVSYLWKETQDIIIMGWHWIALGLWKGKALPHQPAARISYILLPSSYISKVAR